MHTVSHALGYLPASLHLGNLFLMIFFPLLHCFPVHLIRIPERGNQITHQGNQLILGPLCRDEVIVGSPI